MSHLSIVECVIVEKLAHDFVLFFLLSCSMVHYASSPEKEAKVPLTFSKKWRRQTGNLRTLRTLMVSEMAENNNCSLSFGKTHVVSVSQEGCFLLFLFPSTSLAKPDTSRHSLPQVELARGGGGAGPGLTHLLASREFRNTQIAAFMFSQKK